VLIIFIYLKKDFLLQNIDSTYFLLSLFSLVYAAFYVFNMEQGVQWLIIYAIFPSAFYLLGKKMVFSNTNSITLFYLFFILAFMYSITGVLSVGINLLKGGFVQVGRSIADFWTGKEKLATAMGAFFIFNMSVPGILIAAKNKLPIWVKIFAGGIFFISLLCVFRLGSRTQIVLIILSILFALIYLLKSQNMVSNFKLALGVVVVIFLSINYLSIDLDAEYLSSLGERLQQDSGDNAASAGGRTGRWEKSIVNLYEKPLGWDVNEFGYSHNMWFDAARNGSVISFVLLLIFTIKATLNIKKALQAEPKAILFNSTVLIYSIAIFSQLFVEPALESLFILFVFFCFMQGVLNAYTQKVKKEKQQT
tara:strand:- start:19260 stop:20351 length:1092 start_codon:yes stop_codon:yes gene_type:complete